MLSYGTSDCDEFNTKNEDLSTINKTYDRLYDSTTYADENLKKLKYIQVKYIKIEYIRRIYR